MTHKINIFKSFSLLAILLFYTQTSFCQTIERILEKGGAEIEGVSRWNERYFASDYDYVKWNIVDLAIRYGFTEWLTGSMEGLVYKNSAKAFPNYDYRDYVIGIGLCSKLWTINNFRIVLGGHYLERLDFDRSIYRHDKLQESYFIALGFQQCFYLPSTELIVFVSPAFVRDQLSEYIPSDYASRTSVHNFGIAIGFDALVFQHVHLVTQVVYADYLQPRVGVGYVF